MRILMLAPEPVFQPRGTPISVVQRLEELSMLGHEVDLVTYHLGHDIDISGLTIHRIPAIAFAREVKVGPSYLKLLLDLLMLWKALRLLLNRSYDLVHSHEEAAFFGVPLAKAYRIRHIYDVHSVLSRQLTRVSLCKFLPIMPLFDRLQRWAIYHSDAVISISKELEAYAREINPTAIHVMLENLPIQQLNYVSQTSVQSAAELREQFTLDGTRTIVYTGTLEPYQGIELLMDAAEILVADNANVQFLLVGGLPSQIEFWRCESERRRLDRVFRLLGPVPIHEVATYYEIADLLVSPRREGMSVPLKIYSYLASGKPIVATNIESHTSILSDEYSRLVAPTPKALAEGILDVLGNPERAREMAMRAQDYIHERCNIAEYIEKLGHVYGHNGTEQADSRPQVEHKHTKSGRKTPQKKASGKEVVGQRRLPLQQ